MLTMEVVNLIVGICALLFTAGVYFIHDRKLKQQQKILNEYQLKVVEQNKKAEVRATIINRQSDRLGNRSGTLVIKNYGKATAYNVRFKRKNEMYSDIFDSCWDYPQLLPGESQEKHVECRTGEQTAIVTWDDEFGKNRQYKRTLDL